MRRTLLFSACLLVTSLARAQNATQTLTVQPMPTAQPTHPPSPKAGCGDPHVKFHVTKNLHPTMPAPGASTVYVIEEYPEYFIQPTLRVGMDGHWMGAVKGRSYLSFPFSTGEHHLCVNWQSKLSSAATMFALAHWVAQPRETYYFLARVIARENGDYYTLDFAPVDSDEAKLLISESTAVNFTRKGQKKRSK